MAQAVYVGRCMCAHNLEWHVFEPLTDFDAVSLYPSAMARLYTVEGIPTVISQENLNYEFLSQQTAYVVKIRITNCHKHYPFPLIVQKINGKNINNDNISEPIVMYVDNIFLENLTKFQQIELTVEQGYYWQGKKDFRIQKEIKKIFAKRLAYKKEHNSLEAIYKLIMNSCYGKTLERAHSADFVFKKSGPEYEKFMLKNYNTVVEDLELLDCYPTTIHKLKRIKPIDKHFNFSLLGIHVLSMSKRIMNEVMCLAHDENCKIYYQDTESMHIRCEDLSRLETAYKALYNRDLIGSEMGQFHSDFAPINGHKEVPHTVEAIFLMKKMYIDKLTDSSGEISYHVRGKGLTQNSIKAHGDLIKLYLDIFNGETKEFDLTIGQPCFKMNKNMSISTLNEFKRKIKTNYKIGDPDKYFT
jgi:hypothetical protein